MIPILQAAGITVNHQSYNGTDTGATLQSDLSSLVTAQLNSTETVVVLPWQSASNAELFGQTMQQQGKTATLFGTDGTDSPSQFNIPGTYVSAFGPDISTSKAPLAKSIVKGVAKYGPYGPFGVPTWEATTVEMDAIASICKAGKTPTRANVLAAIRETNIPPAQSVLGLRNAVCRARRTARSAARRLRARAARALTYNRPPRARSSAGERSLHTREVAGSKPAVPSLRTPGFPGVFL